MNEVFLAVMNLVWLYGQRMMAGPPLSEFEFCLYQQACRVVEQCCRVSADGWEKLDAGTEDDPAEDE